ncbi:MAG: hypothetical protein NXI15_12575 [Gammaproteobacteria bacterium]|nr:hypothetical protein [Gammaproteobacteria bacterium]
MLVLTLVMSMLAATVLQSASLQLRYSGNLERRLETLSVAGGISTAVRERIENFPGALQAGQSNCEPPDTRQTCAFSDLQYTLPIELPPDFAVRARVTRSLSAVMLLETPAAGSGQYALYEIDVEIFDVLSGARLAQTVTGVALPAAPGEPRILYWRQPGIDAP